MATKLYLRTASSSYAPTTGDKSSTNPRYTSGANNASSGQQALQLSVTKGGSAGGTNHAFTSDATTATRTNYMGRWTSQPLAGQIISADTWTFAVGLNESNTNADSIFSLCVYTAAQGGSAIKQTIYDSNTDLGTEWSASTTSAGRVVTFSGATVSVDNGDVLVIEVFRNTVAAGQGMGTAYSQIIYFGGATEPTASSTVTANDVATYLSTTNTLDFSASVTLSSPANGGTVTTSTPNLDFVGTAPTGNNLEFQINILDPAGTPALLDSYSESNSDQGYAFALNAEGYGQTIRPSSDCLLKSVKFYLRKFGSPTGTIEARLYATTGTYGSTAIPTGSLIDSSASINVSTLTTSETLYEFTFATPSLLTANTTYALVVYTPDTSSYNIGSSIYPAVYADDTSPTHGGNRVALNTGTWFASAATDFCFYAYVAPVSVDKQSASDAGFTNVTNGGDTHPFNQTDTIRYTVQTPLADGTYYWYVKGKDTVGDNVYGNWSSLRNFIVSSSQAGGIGGMQLAMMGCGRM